MKIVSARFLTGAVGAGQYPGHALPEFAFFGKSNCGKSSLINMLVQRHSLVKTGSRPGMTQQINFFVINESFCLTDLPGTGYSRLPGELRKALQPMVLEYCKYRDNLKAIFYLLDLRREPGEEELATLALLQSRGVPVRIVGTKMDKLGSNELRKNIQTMADCFGLPPEELLLTSASKKMGRLPIVRYIEELLS